MVAVQRPWPGVAALVSAMALRVYRTNWLLLILFWLGLFFFLHPHRRLDFFAEYALVISSGMIGWLLQCVAVIIITRWHERSKGKH